MSKQELTWFEVREARLQTDYERLAELARDNELIALESCDGDPPESYVIRFSCIGVVAPGAASPVLGDNHRVEISLPIEYPTRPPLIRWLTPIFHPNVNREGTAVCIDVWYPSKFLDDLCVMLGRMIQYQNYNTSNALHREAALWASRSPELFPVDQRPLRRGEVAVTEFEIKLL